MLRWIAMLLLVGCDDGSKDDGETDVADIEIQIGDLPLIISAPHGGALTPTEIPDRTTGKNSSDSKTAELAWEISALMEDATGLKPHLIINNLHRKKLDANREIVEAAEGNERAELAWATYHDGIAQAQLSVTRDHVGGLYIDLHGHDHDIARIELGYLTNADELTLSDSVLDSDPTYVAASSIPELVTRSGRSFSMLLRGGDSLGAMLEAEGQAVVPGPTNPDPAGEDYYNGGYSTELYGSRDSGTVSGIQIETHRSDRTDATARTELAEAISAALLEYLATVYDDEFRIDG